MQGALCNRYRMSPAEVRRAPLAVLLLRLNEARQAEGLHTHWLGSVAASEQTGEQVRKMLNELRRK